VDLILDEAEQKGTGRWTAQSALELGVPIPTIDAAVWSRTISAFKEERVKAARLFPPSPGKPTVPPERLIEAVRAGLYAAKIASYAQGMTLLRAASNEYAFGLDLAELARIWKGGCIIRARLLSEIQRAFRRNPDLPNLLVDPQFREALLSHQEPWRLAVETAVAAGVPYAATSASLAYFDSYRSERLPANLTQAQRDFFGAHTYQRVDRPGVFHTRWEG
jgi:6-phosphogluconate dehydrogenase